MLSVIIPARNELYLQKTIDSAFANAGIDIQVVVALDGYWPNPQLVDRPHLIIHHAAVSHGMRSAINTAAQIASGEFIMKADAHCAFAPGFAKTLVEACKPNTVLVPVRKRLNIETWQPTDNDPPEFQFIRQEDLKGKDWPEYAERVKGQDCPQLMTMQGSCWFMRRSDFIDMGMLDAQNYGAMGREAQEISLKTWLSGRQLYLCRGAWYAHWDKTTGTYKDMRAEKEKSAAFACDCWKNNRWPGAKRTLKSLIEQFAPVPTWDNTALQALPDTVQAVKPTPPANAAILRPPPCVTGVSSPYICHGMNRAALYRYFASLGFTKGAEIGVFTGANAKTMFRNIPGLHLHLVEPHADYPFSSRTYGSRLPSIIERANRRLRNRNCTWHKTLSENAVRDIPDLSLDFVYIDGDHTYDFCMLDIILWFRKVRSGGIISGHDYFVNERQSRHAKVTAVVNDYTKIHRINPWYITDTKAAVEKGDKYASWFFIKTSDKWPNQ